jgi:hypothetical protein
MIIEVCASAVLSVILMSLDRDFLLNTVSRPTLRLTHPSASGYRGLIPRYKAAES